MAVADGIFIEEKGLTKWARVTQVISTTQFQAAGLSGQFGDGDFVGWTVYVLNHVPLGAAPQREQVLCTAYLGNAGFVSHAAFSASLSIGDEVLLIHPSISQAVIAATFDAVHYDSVLGTPGTAYPQGAAGHPVNNLADALTIANARNLRTIKSRGVLPITQDVPGFTFDFEGDFWSGLSSLRLGTFNMNGVIIKNALVLDSVAGGALPTGTIECTNCVVSTYTPGGLGANFIAIIKDSWVFAFSGSNLGTSHIINSEIYQIEGGGANGGAIWLLGCSGACQVTRFTAANHQLVVHGGNIRTQIDPTNTGGTIWSLGSAHVFDLSAGAGVTVNVDVRDTGRQELIYYGVVNAIPGANQFTITYLSRYGTGKFAGATNPYYAFVLRDNGGASAAPQGELQPITAYNTVTGAFTTNAFTAAVAVGDEILILHPSIAAAMATLTGLNVPAADSAANVLMRDVVGNKTDTNAGTSILSRQLVPTADVVTNVNSRDVIGSKADAAVTLVGVVASIVAYVKGILNQVNLIFALVNAIFTLKETGGTITTDGTEQNIYINNAPLGVFKPKKVLIDFTNQTAGETVVVRVYYRIISGGNLRLKDTATFAGVQTPALKNVDLEPNRFGVQVTIQRTVAVADRAYDYEIFYED